MGLTTGLQSIPGAIKVWHGITQMTGWKETADSIRRSGGRLLALWGSDGMSQGHGMALHAAYAAAPGVICLSLPLGHHKSYPDLAETFPAAGRMQRAVRDLLGIDAIRGRDPRPWLRHAGWSEHEYPLRKSFDATRLGSPGTENYAFVNVAGDGVHEIPVGPVHAGVIEPGHFRFQVIGERVLRLEERLGYKHKGIEKRFESMSLLEGAKLAGRVSGDSTVAYAWAYAMAVESVTATAPPPRAVWLRALLLERERVANHLGDLGALGNDAGFAFGLTQFSRLKEQLLRTNAALFGHRYAMDLIIPGGVTCDLAAQETTRLLREIEALEAEVRVLRDIYEDHAGLQDRFIKTGIVTPEFAVRFGLCGTAGRASGVACDARVQHACAPYDLLDVRIASHTAGDVAARVHVRFGEVFESLRLQHQLLAQLPAGDCVTAIGAAPEQVFGIGLVEGWRGEVLFALETGSDNRIARAHPHDPSWQNWPLLELAVIGNIVPDFPLINKSFNLSYSGHDL